MNELQKMLEKPLQDAITEIQIEILSLMPDKKEIDITEEIPEDIVNKLFNKYQLPIMEKYKPVLNNIYSISKYLLLLDEEKELIKEVEKDLNTFLDPTKLKWTIHADLSNQITFMNIIPINSDIKPQNLIVKYYKVDDIIQYSIASGKWGWNISKDNLKAILENTYITPDTNCLTKSSTHISTDATVLKIKGVKIIIEPEEN